MTKGQQQETAYPSPFGLFHLSRHPGENDPTLRAWSAADDYLLTAFKSERLPGLSQSSEATSGSLLIANDAFGALSVCLHSFQPLLWSDSCVTGKALAQNLAHNDVDAGSTPVRLIPSTHPLPSDIHTVLMHLPKSHAYLRYQLQQIRPKLTPDALIMAGTMVKHFHPNVLQIFEEEIGPTHTSLARKKARLIIARPDPATLPEPAPDLASYSNRYPLPDGPELVTLPNVFSYDKLDIGTRALLPHIPSSEASLRILDLGCGNGALGIRAALQNPRSRITFCDESWLAMASARLSAQSAGVSERCDFLVTDTLEQAPGNQDLILCNPPFHQQNSMHTQIARRMFQQAARHLTVGGRLLVVANRHLRYQQVLRRYFRQVRQLEQNRKFVVLEATKG